MDQDTKHKLWSIGYSLEQIVKSLNEMSSPNMLDVEGLKAVWRAIEALGYHNDPSKIFCYEQGHQILVLKYRSISAAIVIDTLCRLLVIDNLLPKKVEYASIDEANTYYLAQLNELFALIKAMLGIQ